MYARRGGGKVRKESLYLTLEAMLQEHINTPPAGARLLACAILSTAHSTAAAAGMEVTQDDLQRQCAAQYDAYIRCVSDGGAENCLTQQHELEQCATATVQLVRAINSSCSKQYAHFQACFKRGHDQQIANPDCDSQSATFWECAQVQIARAGEVL